MATTDSGRTGHRPRWSIVVPAFNEAERIEPSLDAVLRYFRGRGETFEILVVDDGSKDETAAVIAMRDETEIRLLRSETNLGKGSSVKKGVGASRGELVLLTDADLPVPLETLEDFLVEIEGGVHVVCGSKALARSRAISPQPIHRRALGRVFNTLVRILRLSRFRDTQCGFKLFQGSVARRLFELSRVNGFVFDVEILYLAQTWGYRLVELPVPFQHIPMSRVRAIGGGRQMLSELVKLRWSIWRGQYETEESAVSGVQYPVSGKDRSR